MSVSRDTTSLVWMPASPAEWRELFRSKGIPVPTLLWLCQETTGSLADSSSGNFTGFVKGSPAYQQAIPNWSRKGILLHDGNAEWFQSNTWPGSLTAPVGSSLAMVWATFPTAAASTERSVLTFGSSFGTQVAIDSRVSANPYTIDLAIGGGQSQGGTSARGQVSMSGTHPFFLRANSTVTTASMRTDNEILSSSIPGTMTLGELTLGGDNVFFWLAPGVTYMYVAAWIGSDAEMTDGQLTTIIQTFTSGSSYASGTLIPFAATGTYSDASSANVSSQTSWVVSDNSKFVVTTAGTGSAIIGGHLYGANVGITGTIGAVAGTGTVVVVSSDSASFGAVPYAIKTPMQDDHWQVLGLSPWGSYWGLQEPSGSNCVSSGSTQLTMVPLRDVSMLRNPAGWVRNGLSVTKAGQLGTMRTPSYPFNSAALATGVAIMSYSRINVIASRTIMGQCSGTLTRDGGQTADMLLKLGSNNNGSGLILDYSGSGGGIGLATPHVDGRFHPLLIVYDPVNSRIKAYSDLDVITGSFPGAIGTGSNALGMGWLGENSNGTGDHDHIYFAVATGSVATALSDDGKAAAFLKKLGWTPRWNWTSDLTAFVAVPQSYRDWQELITGSLAGVQPPPDAWGFQATTGTIPNLIGTRALGVEGSPLYQQSVTNWSRKACSVVDSQGSLPLFFTNNGGSDPDLHTNSRLVFALVAINGTPGGIRNVIEMGGSDSTGLEVDASGHFIARVAGNTATGVVPAGSTVHPVFIKSDITNSVFKVYTDKEIITPTWTTPIVNSISTDFGAFFTLPGPVQYLYGCHWFGSAAEWTDAQIRAIMYMMGWAPAW